VFNIGSPCAISLGSIVGANPVQRALQEGNPPGLTGGSDEGDIPTADPASGRHEDITRRLIILIALYMIPTIVVIRPVDDPDLWWHLRTGQWIMQLGTVPRTDPFSSFGQGKPWIAYSWLFELMTYGAYRGLGLAGVVLLRVALVFVLTAAIHRFVTKREPRFVVTTGLTGLALLPIAYLMSERPWIFTVLFFTLTMDAVLDLRAGRSRPAIWLLPLCYVLWANLHVQFIHGLFLLMVACAAALVDRQFAGGEAGEHAGRAGSRAWWHLVLLTIACVLATLCNPYGLRLYGVVTEYAAQTGAYDLVEEHLAMDFRAAWHWGLLALALAAAFGLGRRRRVSSFEVLLFIAAVYFSFHSRRDCWFMVLTSLAILTTGNRPEISPAERFRLTRRRVLALGAGIVVMIAAIGWGRGLSRQRLEQTVDEKYPSRAAAYVEKQGYRGALYNSFDWGGYLIWRLPDHLVAIDGRTNLHGVERIVRSYMTWGGQPGWSDDPELRAARIVIGSSTSPLTHLLRADRRFDLVYDDPLAVVFVASDRAGTHAKETRQTPR
jgi:hypothetical protein